MRALGRQGGQQRQRVPSCDVAYSSSPTALGETGPRATIARQCSPSSDGFQRHRAVQGRAELSCLVRPNRPQIWAIGSNKRKGERKGGCVVPPHTCDVSGHPGHITERKGGDSNPRTTLPPSTVFKTAAFNRSATLPRGSQMLRGQRQALDWQPPSKGEVAEWLKALAC